MKKIYWSIGSLVGFGAAIAAFFYFFSDKPAPPSIKPQTWADIARGPDPFERALINGDLDFWKAAFADPEKHRRAMQALNRAFDSQPVQIKSELLVQLQSMLFERLSRQSFQPSDVLIAKTIGKFPNEAAAASEMLSGALKTFNKAKEENKKMALAEVLINQIPLPKKVSSYLQGNVLLRKRTDLANNSLYLISKIKDQKAKEDILSFLVKKFFNIEENVQLVLYKELKARGGLQSLNVTPKLESRIKSYALEKSKLRPEWQELVH